MGKSSWSIRMAETVDADADAVAGWWFHPDRAAEFLAELKSRKGVVDMSVTESTKDGHRVRVLIYKSTQGWEFEHRMAEITRPERVGDRYRVETHDAESARDVERQAVHRYGWQPFTVDCFRVLEVIAIRPDETRVTDTHEHTMAGGTWGYRWKRRQSDMKSHKQRLKKTAQRCAAAIGQAEDTATAP